MAAAARKIDPETGELPTLLMKWKAPDYSAILHQRMANLDRIREHPEELPIFKAYYRAHPADFINDWGMTFDPRNADIGLPTLVPFILFDKQREWIDWVVAHWQGRSPGLCEKSRDMGVSWLAMALSCTLCLFRDGIVVGVGSRKTEYVDKIGTHKPLLPKARMFMENLPPEFKGDWQAWRDAPFMRVSFPETGSLIAGEGGDDIGRGDRTSVYFVDEYAHFQHADLTEASLSQTTNCRIDMSSVRGMNNPFARKRHEGKVDVFIFDWHDDPRKDDAWYAKQQADLDPVVVAQEIDRDYSASVHGIVIPGAWVRAAIDAREKLGLGVSGAHGLAFDPADEGVDKNAICGNHGIEINYLEEWSGKGADIFASTEHVFEVCDQLGITDFRYDADGLGADVRGDARVLNERRQAVSLRQVQAIPFRGSGAVVDPEAQVFDNKNDVAGRTNEDYFQNRKAQGWWALRRRFQKTYRWVVDGVASKPDEIISINSKVPMYLKLVAELSQPTYGQSNIGKMVINKKPENTKSPNLADAAMMKFAQLEPPTITITGEMIAQIVRAGGRKRY